MGREGKDVVDVVNIACNVDTVNRVPDVSGMSLPYHHGDLRATLLREAAVMLAEGGSEAVTMRALASRAGVSRTAAYRHFDSKADLLAAVAEEGFSRLAAILERARTAATVGDLVDQGVAYVHFAIRQPARYRLMYGSEALSRTEHAGLQAAAESAYTTLVDSLDQARRHGMLRVEDPQRTAYVVWALLHGLAALLIDRQIDPPDDVEDFTRTAVRTLFDGLAPP